MCVCVLYLGENRDWHEDKKAIIEHGISQTYFFLL